jgi:hypothetical protein
MSIDSDAEKDLALTDEDAENVAGGRMVTRKKASTTKHAAHGSAAATSYTVKAPPLQGDAGADPGMSQAELDSDPDC